MEALLINTKPVYSIQLLTISGRTRRLCSSSSSRIVHWDASAFALRVASSPFQWLRPPFKVSIFPWSHTRMKVHESRNLRARSNAINSLLLRWYSMKPSLQTFHGFPPAPQRHHSLEKTDNSFEHKTAHDGIQRQYVCGAWMQESTN